ncbi:hypothetical protein RI138_00675 [Streptomyces sp. C11-1]|uniref:Uncharacterized protein n=1 Tax=Streptomyces durocortorensis TaxID=2811104 RepID=A0ABY9VRR6_9ACTN|nr:hypothetical protein [Streptomyces durocortorensis]WNF25431.1 hypothetical protein RI138_00675 [Streptomyces durocortorensis]
MPALFIRSPSPPGRAGAGRDTPPAGARGPTVGSWSAAGRTTSIHLLRTGVRYAFTDRLASRDMGKGCLRFRDPARIDFTLVRDLLRATAATRGTPC